MKDIKEIVANNLVELRKQHKLTQNDLAKKLNYSDNTISRWEHAEITPTLESLQKISEIYNVPIESLLNENICEHTTKNKKRQFINELSTALLCTSGVWLIAIFIFVYANMFLDVYLWRVYIWAIPASCVVLLVFTRFWKNKIYRFVVLTVLLWSLLLSFYLQFLEYNIFLIFIVGIPIEISLSSWAFLRK